MARITRMIARRFAETMLFWRQRLQARDLMDFLGVSERAARALLQDWRTDALLPRYTANRRQGIKPADGFNPGGGAADFNLTLTLLLLADDFPGNPFSSTALPEGGHDLAVLPRSPPRPLKAAREMIAGCLNRQAVRLIYAAKTGRQEFIFSASALIRARGRYHLRGYRANGQDTRGEPLPDRFVDIVPARVVDAWRTTGVPFIGAEGDTAWHAFEQYRFTLSPELSEDERLCYENEYGMTDRDCLEVKERRALMPYVLQELAERRCWRRDGTWVRIWTELAGAPAGNASNTSNHRSDLYGQTPQNL